ncbi:unnamed protein product [Euphydryas editha]|uniref:DDE-1 domain-containing protein n=1 Tax=Euphydryas editha TaxID=104508 RepID=A0AAU9UW33_EUPED|nr:unnamed protein product [Euphydryas editha]
MPRKYIRRADARRYKAYSKEKLEECLLTLQNKTMTQREAEKHFNIPRRTIINYIKARRMNVPIRPPGLPLVFDDEEESQFSGCLKLMGTYGFPVSESDFRYIVKAYLDKTGRTVKRFKNNMPGTEWVASFLSRHPDLSRRFAAKIRRARAAITPDILTEYIEYLRKELENVPAANIWNYDETNVTDDPGNKKVIVKRGSKYPELLRNSSKSSISLMFCGSADGELLPPFVVSKSSCLWTTWTEGGPEGTRYSCSQSGWFDMSIFTEWFQSQLLPKLNKIPGKKVIIGDNLSSHISLDVINQCKENNITFLCLPPNSTHLTQPLDVAFFRPLKVAWRSILSEWKSSASGYKNAILPKGIFPQMLKRLVDAITPNSSNNLKAGFTKCGIYPLDVKPLLDRLPHAIDTEAINDSFIQSLEIKRNAWTQGVEASRGRKKLKIIPGKSVADQMLVSPTTGEIEAVPCSSSNIVGVIEAVPSLSSAVIHSDSSETDDHMSLRDSSEGPFSDVENEDPNILNSENLALLPLVKKGGQYVVFKYEGELFPGVITKMNKKGAVISSMKRSLKNWKWPQPKDELFYTWKDVLGGINPPKKIGRREFYSVPEFDQIWGS